MSSCLDVHMEGGCGEVLVVWVEGSGWKRQDGCEKGERRIREEDKGRG